MTNVSPPPQVGFMNCFYPIPVALTVSREVKPLSGKFLPAEEIVPFQSIHLLVLGLL